MQFKQLVYILFLTLTTLTAKAQQEFGSEKDINPYTFAFQINTNAYGQAVRCAVLYTDASGRERAQYMTTRQWVLQFTGYEDCNANPYRENFIEKYNIFQVPASVKAQGEEEVKTYTIERTESILLNLWRLRYSQYPFATRESDPGKGWAAHPDSTVYFMPSEQQFEILEAYGIKRMNDFFKGEDAYRLMRDILDKAWQNNYATGSKTLE